MAEFDELMQRVGALLGIDILPEKEEVCLLKLEGGTEVVLERDGESDSLLITFQLGEIPPGKAREALLRAALITNSVFAPYGGRFAYSRVRGELILFERVPLALTSTGARGDEQLIAILAGLNETAAAWHHAIRGGYPPPIPTIRGSR